MILFHGYVFAFELMLSVWKVDLSELSGWLFEKQQQQKKNTQKQHIC